MKGDYYTADFETTNDSPNEARVWLSGVYNIYTNDFEWGKDLNWTINYMYAHPGTYYYHNLKFDGNFIIPYLLKNGFKHIVDGKLSPHTFSTIISDMGQFYQIRICLKNKITITILDSLKIINLPVSKIASAFNLPESKGDIDYMLTRPIGYEPTKEEIDYIRRDCSIVGKALKYMFDKNLTKMTQGSNAYSNLKQHYGKNFRKIFPKFPIKIDTQLRQAYKGGYVLVAPRAQNRDIGKGIVLDKNSMYPSHMAYSAMPYGEPIYYDGMYKPDKNFPLYIQMITVNVELKENKLPTIQLKNQAYPGKAAEYITSSHNEPITLCLTSLDLQLMFDNYNMISPPIFHCGYKFMESYTLFDDFVNEWYSVKENAAKENNPAMKQIAKIMLNSSYGKFGTNPKRGSKYPVLNEDGIVTYKTVEYDKLIIENEQPKNIKVKYKEIEPQYIPVASFITAWARYDLITNAQKLYNRFLYADTDSLHLEGTEIPDTLDIDKYRLGAWDKEATFVKARYLRAKSYIEVLEDGTNIVKCSGLPHTLHDKVNWDNFYPELELEGKLQHKTVKNGVILSPTTFKIKP